ncbi:hypothetical protein [Schlesneria sp.]|uniref:hypothetical protein n=1 Tax=Schlesneria sp. TaxID=2762018 RepID=UPI002F14CDA9
MDDFELEQLRKNPQWSLVLQQYQQLHTQGRNDSPEFDGWTPRIFHVEDVPVEELSGIHGKLIAYGFLKFDLAGRDGGLRYQLTPLGKQGIQGRISEDEDEDGDDVAVPSATDSVIAEPELAEPVLTGPVLAEQGELVEA